MERHDAATPACATEEVHVAEPDPKWTAHAERFAAEIHDLLGDWSSEPTVPVAATAVPDLAANPIIDLQATAADPVTAMAAILRDDR